MTKKEKERLFSECLMDLNNYYYASRHNRPVEERTYFKGRYDSFWIFIWNLGFVTEWNAYKDSHFNMMKDGDKDEA